MGGYRSQLFFCVPWNSVIYIFFGGKSKWKLPDLSDALVFCFRRRLYELFGAIEKEFDNLCLENLTRESHFLSRRPWCQLLTKMVWPARRPRPSLARFSGSYCGLDLHRSKNVMTSQEKASRLAFLGFSSFLFWVY